MPRGGGGGTPPRVPTSGRQRSRLTARVRELDTVFAQRRAALQLDAAGAIAEEVVVLETAGTIEDFIKAVRRTPGMEWLVESDEFEVDADDDFGRDEDHPDEELQARIYLVVANQEAIRQLRRLWLLYTRIAKGEEVKFPYGQTKWRDLFAHLRDVRLWDSRDRLQDTGLVESWNEQLAAGTENVRVEIELWYRESEQRRRAAEDRVAGVVGGEAGTILARVEIPEIAYHALLAEIPIAAATPILAQEQTRLISDGEVMFMRPVGQFATGPVEIDGAEAMTYGEMEPASTAAPLVGLLDGLPLSNHFLLRDRLVIDDPDGLTAAYAAGEQHHGTAMASLLIHGDLNSGAAALPRQVYVRPILAPNPNTIDRCETIPEDRLPVDVIHRTVRRIVEGDADQDPAAPTVKIVNYSIGNPWRRFHATVGPLARLIDWLSWKYGILFVVSAGNCTETLDTGIIDGGGTPVSVDDNLRSAVLRAIWREARNRRVIEPAEAVNAIAVGATYADISPEAEHVGLVIFDGVGFPSPISPLGYGFRRSIKPDILMEGGRNAYRRATATGGGTLRLDPVTGVRPPGQRVAAPGPTPGDIAFTKHASGTSNAAALASRTASLIYDALCDPTSITTIVPSTHLVPATKCLLAHSASWPDSQDFIFNSLAPILGNGASRRQVLSRFFGYGCADEERALSSTDERATIIGWGTLSADGSDVFEVPLPPSLSGKAIARRLTYTLAWLTPVNPSHRHYRRASLWVEPLSGEPDYLGVSRRQADHRRARRGTVQHEVLDGDQATAYADGRVLALRVSCRADCDVLEDRIPYALAVSIEVAEPIAIYEEIRTRIREAVRVRAAS
jgi:hypothetical protein